MPSAEEKHIDLDLDLNKKGRLEKIKVGGSAKEVTPIGEFQIKVFEDKPVEIVISGNIKGKHIPKIKRMITRSYLDWVKIRRRG